MTIEEAATDLRKNLPYQMVQCIGIGKQGGQDALYVYVSYKRHLKFIKLPAMWQGFPVVGRVTGGPIVIRGG